MHSLAVKVVSLALLFLLTFVSGVVPLRLRRDTDETRNGRANARRRRILSLSTCFAGGAFFASSMLELLPMVRQEFDAVLSKAGIKTTFPLPEFGISMGFFLILSVEQIIHVMKESRSRSNTDDNSSGAHHKSPLVPNSTSPGNYGSASIQGKTINDLKAAEHDDLDSHNGSDDEHDYPRTAEYNLESKSTDQHHHGGHHHVNADHTHDHSMFINPRHQNHRHYLRSYLLLIALSIHALFEGLAVGLFENIDSMVELLGALIIHKCILAFSIGINLVQHSFPAFMIIKSAALFSAMSPIGLGFGILLLKYTSEDLGHVLSAIFQAIATGTFLYVTFFEIFFHELNSKECHKLLKVLMMISGFAIITTVQYFDTDITRK